MNKRNNKEVISFRYYLLYFLIYACIGWLLETFYAVGTLGYFVKRGFLFGPLCPIYGFGGVILYSLLAKYKKSPLKLFFYSAIVFSAFEYVVSYCLDALFSMHWWDYTNEFFNLNGRISIFYSFAWGIIAIIFINHVYPFLKKKINLILAKIPYIIQCSTLYLLCLIWLVDTVASFIRYL